MRYSAAGCPQDEILGNLASILEDCSDLSCRFRLSIVWYVFPQHHLVLAFAKVAPRRACIGPQAASQDPQVRVAMIGLEYGHCQLESSVCHLPRVGDDAVRDLDDLATRLEATRRRGQDVIARCSIPQKKRAIVGRSEQFILQTHEGLLAFAIDERHIHIQQS